ncbi:glutamate dehydrogenase [Marinobacterium nitratireducens]|uniref:Glutamate dehydrogenase n=1 Tax=Marinobacterium nitratireducens TaxID=518897 RepID=A0A917ZHB4_9GAMM|nr:Glu/Leu/Phe/Val dehydrogenase [Marinobacterium nitratireducens]GGO83238.1 glutamate dehydrogenase [Marinobacterium nitratireducens]
MDLTYTGGDHLGPTRIIQVREPGIGLEGLLVIDNVAAGPAIGGLRMAADVSLAECARLARAMTLKNAAASLAHGGAKSVLVGDPKMPAANKERLIRGFATALRDCRDYIVGPDMGTDENCMAWVQDETGRAVGLPAELGGIPLDQLGATGWGLFQAIREAAADCELDLDGARVAIQGFGAVGRHAARFLAAEGARIVAVSDSQGGIADPAGLDLEHLLALKRDGRSVTEMTRGTRLSGDAIIDVECDIWIPAARPDVIDEHNVDRLRTRLLAEGANIPVTDAAEARLHERGILALPDFIANAGGVICAAMEYRHLSQSAAFDAIRDKIRSNVRTMLDSAGSAGISPRQAALRLAATRVERAMRLKRWSLY